MDRSKNPGKNSVPKNRNLYDDTDEMMPSKKSSGKQKNKKWNVSRFILVKIIG